MAFVYPFPENINKYSKDWLKELLSQMEDNISYYKINVLDKDGNSSIIPVMNKLDLDRFRKSINDYSYILLTYNLYPRTIYPIEKEIRWIIFKNIWSNNFECIARPLHKFYNVWEEIYIKSIVTWAEWIPDDDNSIDFYFNGWTPNIESKEDWAMIQIFLDENSNLPNKINVKDNKYLIFNTKNTLAKNIFVDDFINNFEDKNEIIDGLYKSLSFIKEKYNEKATLIFEYVNPDLETHVVQYSKKDLFLLDIRLNESWKFLSYEEKQNILNKFFVNTSNVKLVEKQDILNENELLKKREEKYVEWYVLKKFESNWDFFHYAKFKTKWYLDRWFYDWLDVVNFTLKDLIVLYTLEEQDTFFQKIDNPKNAELLRKINIDPNQYKNFINELTNIFQDSLVKTINEWRMKLINVNNKLGIENINNKYIHKNISKDNKEKDLLLYKKIILHIFYTKKIDNISKDELAEMFNDNNVMVNLIIKLMYLQIFNLNSPSSAGSNTKRVISNLVKSAMDSDSFTVWTDKIFNKTPKWEYVVITDKQELVKISIKLLQNLYSSLRKISNQLENRNFIFIFYNLVYEDIFENLSKQEKIDRATFNLLLANLSWIVWLNPNYYISSILLDVYKYKNKSDPSATLINKGIIKQIEQDEKELYYKTTKNPNILNLLRLYKYDVQSYRIIEKNIDEFTNKVIIDSLFY